jgi:hypothetical protein
MSTRLDVQAPRIDYVHPTWFEAGKPVDLILYGSSLDQPNFRYKLCCNPFETVSHCICWTLEPLQNSLGVGQPCFMLNFTSISDNICCDISWCWLTCFYFIAIFYWNKFTCINFISQPKYLWMHQRQTCAV